jgi:uncharacterized protein YprB with RNaseH-like and TPR domain
MLNALIARQQASLRDEREHAEKARAAEARAGRPPPWTVRQTRSGTVRVVEEWLEPDHCHGRVAVKGALRADPADVARLALDPAIGRLDLGRMLFIDTETTGLSVGAGTVAFLIGLARFEGESLRIEQLVLPRPGEEGPLLDLLAERLAEASCLVSYNGKSYDWPLLRTRFVLNRRPVPPAPPHLDLLPCARRLYRRRLGEVRLVQLESELLGLRRDRDIAGSEIPALYWAFVRDGRAGPLGPILAHNASDLVALAALLALFSERYAVPEEDADPTDHLSFARVAVRAGDGPRALGFVRRAASGGGTLDVTLEALRLEARLCTRAKDYSLARQRLEEALCLAASDARRAEPFHLELAKLLEHRLGGLELALEHAARVRTLESEADRERRRARLVRRLAAPAGGA